MAAEGLQSGAWATVIHSALFGHHFQSQVTGLLPDPSILAITVGFLILSFPGAALILAVRGSRRAPSAWTPVWILIGFHLVFFLRYNVIDQYTFFIPAMAGIALAAGWGYHSLHVSFFRRLCWILLILQPLLYALTPTLVRASGVLTSFERNKPYRDDYRYLFWPWMRAETSAHQLAQDTLSAYGTGPGKVWVQDTMALYTLKWAFHHHGLADTAVIPQPETPEASAAVWVPARADSPAPAGWIKLREVWIPDSAPPDKASP